MQGIFLLSHFLWSSRGQWRLSVCDSHKVETQTVHFFCFLQFFFKLLCTGRSIRSGSARFAWELRALSPVAFGVAKMLLTNWQTFWLFCFLLGCSPVFLNLHLFYSAEQVMRTKKEGGTRNKINIFAVVQKGNWKHEQGYINCAEKMVTLKMPIFTVIDNRLNEKHHKSFIFSSSIYLLIIRYARQKV